MKSVKIEYELEYCSKETVEYLQRSFRQLYSLGSYEYALVRVVLFSTWVEALSCEKYAELTMVEHQFNFVFLPVTFQIIYI